MASMRELCTRGPLPHEGILLADGPIPHISEKYDFLHLSVDAV
jgi:hypothetical protein